MAFVYERDTAHEVEPLSRETELTHLVEHVGVTPEEARRMMRDDDLWISLPEQRLEVPDAEAVEQWRDAYYALEEFLPIADRGGLGFLVAVTDALARVEVALERAKERVREASAG